MHALCHLRAFVGAIPRASVRKELNRFLAQTKECQKTQNETLKRLLSLNAESEFSQKHHLTSKLSIAEFRKAIPVSDYELFRPYIERVKQGEHHALLGPQNRLLMFTLSSGTTSDSKFIPITQQFFDDYRRGWQIWGIGTLDAFPGCNCRNIFQVSSNYDRFRTAGGTPCGNISGLVAAMQKRIVRSMYTIPGALSQIDSPEAKQYLMMRLGITDDNVGMITTANPSTLLQMAQYVDEHSVQLIEDIAEGRVSFPYDYPEKLLRSFKFRLRKRPHRAHELQKILQRKGQLYPVDYWPGMQVLTVWMGGSAAAYLPSLKKYYGNVPIRDHGLSASEGRMTIPLASGTSAGILDITSHHFEFIPEAEQASSSPVVLEAHELEEGQNYYILLTTSSGLYRYNIRDVVRCTGFHNSTPLLEFLHKGAHIANITGEKVSESQVVSAVSRSVQRLNIDLSQFTVSPAWGDPPGYQLFTETCSLSTEKANLLADEVDSSLQSLNDEYRDKRASGRLARMQWTPIPEGTWKLFSQQRLKQLGGSVEQYKHPCLVPDMNFKEKLFTEIISKKKPR